MEKKLSKCFLLYRCYFWYYKNVVEAIAHQKKVMQNLRVRKQFHAKMENPLLMLWILVQAKIEELSHVFFWRVNPKSSLNMSVVL